MRINFVIDLPMESFIAWHYRKDSNDVVGYIDSVNHPVNMWLNKNYAGTCKDIVKYEINNKALFITFTDSNRISAPLPDWVERYNQIYSKKSSKAILQVESLSALRRIRKSYDKHELASIQYRQRTGELI